MAWKRRKWQTEMNDREREDLRQKIFGSKEQANTSNASSVNPDLLKLFPPSRLERIKRKALRKYAAKQDAQYQKWLEAVSQ